MGWSSVEDMFEGMGVREVGARLLATEDEACGPAERVDRIAGWEAVIAHAQARQLAEMADFATTRRVGGWAETPEDSRERVYDSVNDEVAMARGISAVTAAMHLCLAQVLTQDLPHCFAALEAGRIGLHAARVIVAETDVLSPAHRGSVDAAIAAEAADLTPGQVRDAVRARVLAADADAADKRAAKARADTYVGMAKKPDGVALVYAHLKAEDAVAVTETLDAHARAARAAGDPRSLNQLRVDTFLDRLTAGTTATRTGTSRTGTSRTHGETPDTGPDTAADGTTPARGGDPGDPSDDNTAGDNTDRPARRVNLNLVVSAATVLGLDTTPGMLTGYGHISPAVVRDILDGPDTWIRRLVADPLDGQVLTIDSRARRVTGLLRVFTDTRDGVCRRPFCSNRIDDADHITEHHRGGRTHHANTDGLCQPCHLTRHQAGWTLTPETGTNRVWWTTPTGHTYGSEPPPALGYGTLSHLLLRTITQHGNHRHQHRRTAA